MTTRLSAPQAALSQLVALFQAGRYTELENCSRALLEQNPDWGMGWKVLGTALGIQGKDAVHALKKAARYLPADPEVFNNLGNAQKALGQLHEAEASYRQALTLDPNYADAHNNLGLVLHALERYEDAVTSYRRALAIKHDDAGVHNNLGVTLNKLGQSEAAELSFRQALALSPNIAEAHHNFGNALQRIGRYDEAITCYHRALELNPKYADAYNHLGIALKKRGELDQSLACCRKALAIKSDYADAHNSLGDVLQELGQYSAAQASYIKALECNPNLAEAHNNLGSALKDVGQIDSALVSYRRALAIQPENPTTRSNLLFVINFSSDHSPSARLEQARIYGEIASKKVGERFTKWQCAVEPERLKIGVVSGDLFKHPVSFALESMLSELDFSRVELYAYSTNPKTDELTARLQSAFAAWRPIYGKSDAEAAQLIHADGVHVLLDLSGHTAYNRLPVFTWKPAPVQVSWLGYFATTGVAEMDYLLTSEVAVPAAQREQFTEHVWYLPDIWLCFTPPNLALAVNALPALRKGYLTFGCFQRLDKISDAALNAWGRILTALPNARLCLASKQLGDPVIVEQLQQRLQQYGIEAARVNFLGAANSREEYLARYADVDVMLDSFPYPGVTTTCEAMWMGVPTMTLAGETLLSRQGAGMLVPAGLGAWIASSAEDYVEKAVQLTSDLPRLAALRAGLRQQVLASPVFDAPRFARNFVDALWDMWRKSV